MTDLLIWPPLLGVLGMVVAVIIYMVVRSYDPGSDALKKIADAIHEGAMVFMKREYTQLTIFAAVLVVAIFFSLGSSTAIAFLAGAYPRPVRVGLVCTPLPKPMSERLMQLILMGKPALSQLPSLVALSWDSQWLHSVLSD